VSKYTGRTLNETKLRSIKEVINASHIGEVVMIEGSRSRADKGSKIFSIY
jgi:hypothetical protein